MGRRKMEKKRIEDKDSRHAAFSKRRAGLNKKARQLSVLCDADVAVVVFSSTGNLYEYCTGNTGRYQKSCPQTEEKTTQEGASQDMEIKNMCTRFRTCNELRLSARRLDEEGNKASVNDMTELEEELTAALMHTRARKTQLMMERISTFHEQERKLTMEKEQLKQQVAAAAKEKDDDVDDGGGVGDDIATTDDYLQTTALTQQLVTLPLFKD